MEKNLQNLKFKRWDKRDYILVPLVYVINYLILGAMLLFAVKYNGTNILDFIKDSSNNFLSFVTLLFILVAFMAFYLLFENRDFLKEAGNSEMLFLIIEVTLVICFFTGKVSIYLRPFALAAILTMFLTDSRTAVFLNIVFCTLFFMFECFSQTVIDSSVYYDLFFFVLGMASGMIAIYVMKDVYSRFPLLLLGFLVSIPIIICIELSFVNAKDEGIVKALISGVFSGPLAAVSEIILLPIFERIFKKVTCFKLSEISDHRAKLIKRLMTEAPGTFNHSIIVSNIAEACATAIGEDALLARTCAYYHDLGKINRPEFFKENQSEGDNPHDELNPELSANIIKAHTIDGYDIANRNKLPKIIADVMREHHGTLPILFFYDKAKKLSENGEVNISKFCYEGPKPQSKMSAIIMIADGAEAATRSISDRSKEKVSEVVKKLVEDRYQLGQFDECEITLKELNIISKTVVNSLTGVYHNRIKYPKVNINKIDMAQFEKGARKKKSKNTKPVKQKKENKKD